MSLFAILLGGDLVRTSRLEAQLAGAHVIAADCGMRHAPGLGVTPELWVGDFDSVSEADIAAAPTIERQVFPREKDKTDGELAVETAIERGATSLVLVGAFGGERADHAFLHQTAAISLAEAGTPVILTSGDQEATPLPIATKRFDYPDGTVFSILAFSALSGLSVTGARWPLDNVEIAFGSSLTLSNAVSGELEITLGAGRALLLAHLSPDTNR
ncbi:thiamine diphosphokinase [Mesorhizobium xinjiangense]|uniref:thiamine diphosphokinase n=1 Tax=Mesorhizobium xinjiangense TaxID=2678685 RepID=UPI0012EEAC29|nr:thiamine diphosphokinase [Mesorhizobium xinjiangense]